jgi:hypothetical protein
MPERLALCEWCRRRRVERRGARYCSHQCRQRAYEWRRGVDDLVEDLKEANRHTLEAIGRLREVLENRQIIRPRIPQEVPE